METKYDSSNLQLDKDGKNGQPKQAIHINVFVFTKDRARQDRTEVCSRYGCVWGFALFFFEFEINENK